MSQPQLPPLRFPADLEPEYVNLARIMHSATEFVVDVARFLPGMEAPEVQSRIVLSPLSAKLLLRALSDNVAKYEAAFGEIAIPGSPSLADLLFRPPSPPPPAEDRDG